MSGWVSYAAGALWIWGRRSTAKEKPEVELGEWWKRKPERLPWD